MPLMYTTLNVVPSKYIVERICGGEECISLVLSMMNSYERQH